jgi:hypothetical protein
MTLDLVKPARLLVPSLKNGVPGGAFQSPDHFTCYRAKRSRGSARFARQSITIETQFETATMDVIKPLRLCAPTNKNDEGIREPDGFLTCYRVRATGTFPPLTVAIDNQFGSQSYSISQRREFCVPTARVPVYGSPARAFLSRAVDLLD